MTQVIYLKPKSGFRTPLRSDTLWGMICWGIRSVYGVEKLEDFIASFHDGKPICQLSSAFPYLLQDGKPLHFFPRPILPPLKAADRNKEPVVAQRQGLRDRKNLKKIEYLPEAVFREFASGKLAAAALGKQLVKARNAGKLLQPQVDAVSMTHNTINRWEGGTLQKEVDGRPQGQLFHQEENFIRQGGLFFLLRGESEQVEAGLRFLSHVGFGADRNTGKGVFEVEKKPFDDFTADKPTAMVSLSLYYPQREELQQYLGKPHFNYQLEDRQGEISFGGYGRIKKDVQTMFAEGSCFPYHEAPAYGRTEIVKREGAAEGRLPHDVYQYGYGFMVPLALKTNET